MVDAAGAMLVCRVGTRLCAFPTETVVETMRPAALEPVADVPRFVRGIAVIRGVAVPVLDAAALLGVPRSEAARFVTLRVDGRHVALAVDEVLGVRKDTGSLQELPPLLRDADQDAISAIGVLDESLLLVLRIARLVPDAVWAALESEQVAR